MKFTITKCVDETTFGKLKAGGIAMLPDNILVIKGDHKRYLGPEFNEEFGLELSTGLILPVPSDTPCKIFEQVEPLALRQAGML